MARVIFLTDFSEAYARELLLGMARYAHDTAQAWSLCRLPLSIRDKFGIEAVVAPLRTKRQHYPRFDNLFLLYRVTYPFLSLAGRGIFVQRVTTWRMEYGKN